MIFWKCDCGAENDESRAYCHSCDKTWAHQRAITLRREAEAQCERMRRRWLDEVARREHAEAKLWAAERETDLDS